MRNELINILGLVVGPMIAIFLGYLQVRVTRGLVRSQTEKETLKPEREYEKTGLVWRVVLQALFSYPFAFYVLISELSSPDPVTRSSVYFMSLSIGIIILGVLLNAITITFASSNHLFRLILTSMEKAGQVEEGMKRM